MSMPAEDIIDWLDSLPKRTRVGIGDGGLTLITEDGSAYLEIGGHPEPTEDE